MPYLDLSALDSYAAPEVAIPYAYSAESDVHDAKCVLEILETAPTGESYFTYSDDFVKTLPREGVILLDIEDAGYYRLTVTLLSSRGTLRSELKFASDSVEFEVVP